MTARFKCMQVVETEQGRTAQFQAMAADGSAENKAFFAAPVNNQGGSGQLQFALIADGVVFKPGKSYTVELTEVTS